MERNTKAILISFLIITILLLIMYFSLPKQEKKESISVSTGFFPGIGNGSIKIIEFSDFACPVCKIQAPVIKEIIKGYDKEIVFYYRNFPLPMHKNSFLAALASLCANEQDKFWEYHDILFENQGDFEKESLKKYAKDIGLNEKQFNDCLDKEKYKKQVQQDIDEGMTTGMQGTPTFFINGLRAEGFQSLESLKDIIEKAKEKSLRNI